jgi:hypothetical protein
MSFVLKEGKIPERGNTDFSLDIRFYLTPLGQAKQFIEACGI